MDWFQNLCVKNLVIMEFIPKTKLKFQVTMFLWCFSKYIGVQFFWVSMPTVVPFSAFLPYQNFAIIITYGCVVPF